MIKKQIFFSLAFLFCAEPVFSKAVVQNDYSEFVSYWYAGASIAEGAYSKGNNKKTKRSGVENIVDAAHVGYRINKLFSTELELQNLGAVSTKYNSQDIDNYNQLTGSMRWHYPILNTIDSYVKAGASHWWEDENQSSGFSGVIGGGASLALNQNLDLRVEYQYTHSLESPVNNDVSHHMAIFSLLARFGHSKHETIHEETILTDTIEKPVNILPKKIIVTLSDNTNAVFAHNSSILISSKPFKPTLSDLKRYSDAKVIISGHTDSSGSDEYNLWLSERRAFRVADYFVSQGINPSRVKVMAYGESQPIGSNDTEEGRALNRRVEIELFMED